MHVRCERKDGAGKTPSARALGMGHLARQVAQLEHGRCSWQLLSLFTYVLFFLENQH